MHRAGPSGALPALLRRLPLPAVLAVLAFLGWVPPAADALYAMSPAIAPGPSARPGRPSVEYILHIPAPATHQVRVEAHIPAQATHGGSLELMMAVWTPGSYLVREYARHVESLQAATEDGTALAAVKVTKNRWRIAVPDTEGGTPVVVRYTLYCHELTVRTNFVDPDFALLNGAATYLVPATPDGPAPGPYRVRVELPDGWQRTATSLDPLLDPAGEPAPHAYQAPDFDTLVDAPIYAGNGHLYDLEVDGVPHQVLAHGESGPWEGEKAVSDMAKIVRAERAFWGELPYQKYLFINLIVEGRGGLEHADSSVLMTSRWKMGTREGYLSWLGLVAHELFHAWNVKRLRPAALVSFDYEQENYTRQLWIAEGFTSYYGDLLVHRAGLSTRKEWLESLSKLIKRLQTTPGRKVQTLEGSSFDAWIKLYRPDEDTINSAVSYYTKGAVVAFLLDAAIRRYTDGQRSLDDALRLAWSRYGKDGGAKAEHPDGERFTEQALSRILAETAGRSLDGLLNQALTSTDELDYDRALEWFGLRFKPPKDHEKPAADGEATPTDPDDAHHSAAGAADRADSTGRADQADRADEAAEHGDPGDDDKKEPAAWLGAESRVEDGLLEITSVPRGTPAYDAGLSPGDELVAIGGFRVPPRGLDERLEAFRPGQKSTLLVARRERLLELDVTFGDEPEETWELEVAPDATDAQRAHLAAWLGTTVE